MLLHGPHHSAQKSTTTGLSDPATVSSKVDVDKLTIPAMVAGFLFDRAAVADDVYWWCNRGSEVGIPRLARTTVRSSAAGTRQWVPLTSCHRSASMAAMQPDPAAVMACLYVWSWTSPQANTPSMLVAEEPGWVMM